MQWLYKAKPVVRRGLRFGTAAWSVIDIADSWKSNRQPGKNPPPPPPTKTESMSVIPLFHKWMNGRGVCEGGVRIKTRKMPNKDFILVSSAPGGSGGDCLWRATVKRDQQWRTFWYLYNIPVSGIKPLITSGPRASLETKETNLGLFEVFMMIFSLFSFW